MVRKVVHVQKQNPLSDLNKILPGGRYPQRNQLSKFWCEGLRADRGSKFALLHWLWSLPLLHSRTTVRVCDDVSAKRPV